jgi:hypothetical protein
MIGETRFCSAPTLLSTIRIYTRKYSHSAVSRRCGIPISIVRHPEDLNDGICLLVCGSWTSIKMPRQQVQVLRFAQDDTHCVLERTSALGSTPVLNGRVVDANHDTMRAQVSVTGNPGGAVLIWTK